MGQRQKTSTGRLFGGMAVFLAVVGGACDRKTDPVAATQPAAPRVAEGIVSLSPAATDLLVGMRVSGRIVGVSNYEPAGSALAKLPHVGDYQRTDWEQIDAAGPKYMIVQGRADRLPAGLKDQADARGILLVTLEIDRLDDVLKAIDTLAEKTHSAGGPALRERLRQNFDELSRAATQARAGRPALKTLIVISDDGMSVVGTGNFIDDLLTLAGGVNVVQTPGYPTLDREKIAELNPDVILQLMPAASDVVVAKATDTWKSMPAVAAVKSGRIYTLTQPFVLTPGSRVGIIGVEMLKRLYPVK